MKRRTHANPMRLLIMLAVMWAAGSWLFAAESSPPARAKPAPQAEASATTAQSEPASPHSSAQQKPAEEESAASADAASEQAAQDAQAAAPREEVRSDDEDKEESEKPKAASAESESAADAGASPRRFVPSEQVRADFDVSFPIDI